MKTGFDDWSHWLPANRAWAVQSELSEQSKPYTRAIAHKVGWQWRIPLQHRAGNGLVYCNDFMDEETARDLLLKNVPEKTLIEPRPIRFTTGQRKQYWNKNCIAIGLSSGFIEPLESTSIHFIQNGIMWLLLMFPDLSIEESTVREYNTKMRSGPNTLETLLFCITHSTSAVTPSGITVETWSCRIRLNTEWSCLNVQPVSSSPKMTSLRKPGSR